MAVPQPVLRSVRCDGCAREAGPSHLRERIARLEWASRFRPIHIAVLLLAPSPAGDLEDYFYFPASLPRDPGARAFVEDVFTACAVTCAGQSREAPLRALQHRGIYLADCLECPFGLGEPGEFAAQLAALMPTLLRRVRVSYRPKSAVLLSRQLAPVAEAFAAAGLGSLLAGHETPLDLPDCGDPGARDRFRSQLAALLAIV